MDDWQTRSFWGQPERYHGRATALYVIGPYPTAEFLEKLKNILKPKTFIVAVDEGWNRRQIEDIGCLVKKGFRYAKSRNGFVHAKLYLAVWETCGTRTACLVWGSANASLGGFNRNAEAVSRLIPSDDGTLTSVLKYFEKLENSEGKINSLDIAMHQGLRIQLPTFRFYSNNRRSVDSFGAWIQAGFLCYQFTPDSRFGHLVFNLKKELPRTITEKLFADGGFLRDKNTYGIRWAYCNVETLDADSASGPRWRAKYFVETRLGYWTSHECFNASKRGEDGVPKFHAVRGREKRQKVLDLIRGAKKRKHKEWLENFRMRLNEVVEKLQKKIEDADSPENYFHMKNGKIDFKKYRKQVRRQIKNHRRQANDPTFGDRYVSRYAFHSVPPLRGSADDFNDLVKDICWGIIAYMGKQKEINTLAVTIRRCFPDTSQNILDYDPRKLRKLLNDTWLEKKDRIAQFHVE